MSKDPGGSRESGETLATAIGDWRSSWLNEFNGNDELYIDTEIYKHIASKRAYIILQFTSSTELRTE